MEENTYKFRIGDIVRVLDGRNIPQYTGDWVDRMNPLIGQCYMVRERERWSYGRIGYRLKSVDGEAGEESLGLIFDERGLELANPVDLDSDKLFGFLNGGE